MVQHRSDGRTGKHLPVISASISVVIRCRTRDEIGRVPYNRSVITLYVHADALLRYLVSLLNKHLRRLLGKGTIIFLEA